MSEGTPELDPALTALMQECWAQDPDYRPTADKLRRRMSAIDTQTLITTKALELYPNGFVPTCSSLEHGLRLAVPADVFNGMLHAMPAINIMHHDIKTQSVVRMYNQCDEVVVD